MREAEMVASVPVLERGGGVALDIRVTPRASRDALLVRDGQLRATLRAAPVDGAANAALIALLAGRLGLPRSAVTLVNGATSRQKRVAIAGVTAEVLRGRLAAGLTIANP